MLDALQQQLSDIYRLGPGYDVRDFLITDPQLAEVLGQGAMLSGSEETLLLSQDEEELSLSLFLDAELLERVESDNPLQTLQASMLDDFWKVLEGISHFSCVIFKATRDRNVSLLELELQGEVDKFVSTMLMAIGQSDDDLLRNLHGWLFDNVRYRDDLDAEQRDRYRSANDYAARFCYALQEPLQADGHSAMETLRRFYRLPISDKISHIHTQSLATG